MSNEKTSIENENQPSCLGVVSDSSFDWDKFANALKDEYWWLTDVTVTDIVGFIKNYRQPLVSYWVAFDWMKIETRPTTYGKYLICRKDGKIHW